MAAKKDIRSLSKEELRNFFTDHNMKAFRGNQVYEWLWHKGAHDFDSMTNISKETRQFLLDHFVINHIEVDDMQQSSDGTIKNAIRLHDGLVVESVFIPTPTRTTAARLKKMRNLNPDEIYDQVVAIDRQSRAYKGHKLNNIVFMGMGEPLLNYKNVLKSIEMITSDEGLGMSPRRITLSTVGLHKMIMKLADDEVKFNLAVSLHSAIDEVRSKMMPINDKSTLADLLGSLQYWYMKTNKVITFEYVVWKGINDKKRDIDALVAYCKKVPSKVNLIEYNAIEEDGFVQADEAAIAYYQRELERNNITVNIRHSRGKDIDAACGQLANKTTV